MAKPDPRPPRQEPKTPTAEQLQQLQAGGDYAFDPVTGELTQTRQPTQAATPQGDD